MPSLHWLGLHSSWLEDVTVEHLQQLTPRDRSLLPNLKASFSSGELMRCREGLRALTDLARRCFDLRA